MLEAIAAQLARGPGDPGLLELRAELAGQWSDTKAQLADYTAAIEALSRQASGAAADLKRLHGRRGNAHVRLEEWQEAVADFARVVTRETTDEELLTNQARALAGVLLQAPEHRAALKIVDPWARLAAAYRLTGDQPALDELVKRRPSAAGSVGDLFAGDNDWPRAVSIYSQGITPRTTDVVLLSKRAHAYEALKNWDAAAADWARAAAGAPAGAELLADFARRLADNGQAPLARTHRQTARLWHEQLLQADAGNNVVADQLAELLLDGSPTTLLGPWQRLAVGYALNGDIEQATRRFVAALDAADSLSVRRALLQEAGRWEKVLTLLRERRPNDPLLQLAVARASAQRGRETLARQRPTEAQRELEHARDLFTRLLAAYPKTDWTGATPTQLTSAGGATFTPQADGSILVGGDNPDQDTYTIKLAPNRSRVAAIRLETLPHDALPSRASGRAEDGTFALTGVTVHQDDGASAGGPEAIKVRAVWVDYHEPTREGPEEGGPGMIGMSVETYWSVNPQQGRPHVAVWQFDRPVDLSAGAGLTVRFQFRHPEFKKCGIGRFRLSLTGDANAVTTANLHAELAGSDLAEVHAALGQALAQLGDGAGAAASFARVYDLGEEQRFRYRAAAKAAQAAAGQNRLDGAARAKLRRQALDWLRAELTDWGRRLEAAPPRERLTQDRLTVGVALERWQQDRDLAGVRDAEALAQLPAEEQQAFARLWADAAELARKADGGFRALPAEQQVEEVRKELQKRNPGYDGTLTPQIENGAVTGLKLKTDHVTDLWPVRALIHLQILNIEGTYPTVGPLADLAPLQGLSLKVLDCSWSRVTDLTPLAGMPLTKFNCHFTPVSDLAPLRGMALAELGLASTRVSDLSPLKGVPLKVLMATNIPARDLSPLHGMPLTGLDLHGTTGVTSLRPLQGTPLEEVNLTELPVSNLSPFKGMATLRMANLKGTRVADANLAPLQECPNLTDLKLENTKVTAAGVAELRKALPKCRIDWDGAATEPQ